MTTAQKKYENKRGVALLKRPLYKAGLLLEDDDLTAAVEYTRDMSKLLFRSLFGCGVICGLEVKGTLTCNRSRVKVTISPGVALDCEGNPIHVPKAFIFEYDPKCEPLPEKGLWVTICYKPQCCGPRDISCSVDDEGQRVQTRMIDGFEVRLYPDDTADDKPPCACSCLDVPTGTGGSSDPCCDDESETTETSETSGESSEGSGTDVAPPPICKCFYDHWNGKCDCECCCCNCVYLGFVNLQLDSHKVSIAENHETNPELLVDPTGIRWIRPMLVGYYKCDEHPLPAPAAAPAGDDTTTPSNTSGRRIIYQPGMIGKLDPSKIQKRPGV